MTEKKNNTYLEVNNLSKSFGNFEAIKNIGIDIKEGEFVCFLGPSGCDHFSICSDHLYSLCGAAIR